MIRRLAGIPCVGIIYNMKAVLPLDERHVIAGNAFVEAGVHTLLGAGVSRKTDDGRIVFPYEAIHVDFTLRAA